MKTNTKTYISLANAVTARFQAAKSLLIADLGSFNESNINILSSTPTNAQSLLDAKKKYQVPPPVPKACSMQKYNQGHFKKVINKTKD